jgi:hypothetical protein
MTAFKARPEGAARQTPPHEMIKAIEELEKRLSAILDPQLIAVRNHASENFKH